VDLTGYAAYYDAARAVIAVVESAPGNTIPSSEWISDALQQYRTSDTLLGEFYFENRIRQSNNMRIVDQSGRYASR
jgi:ABC-type branched-subunit amino acid transport system substrate-binding protein